jgi:hypothetical protein
MNIPQLPADKAGHLIAGMAIASVAAGISVTVGHAADARAIGLGAAVLAGSIKEAADWWSNRQAVKAGNLPLHGVELLDAVATGSGGALLWAYAALTS